MTSTAASIPKNLASRVLGQNFAKPGSVLETRNPVSTENNVHGDTVFRPKLPTSSGTATRDMPGQTSTSEHSNAADTSHQTSLSLPEPDQLAEKMDVLSRRVGGSSQESLLKPAALDDNGTQVSSSTSSIKPQSLDGKSITSGVTFALDEKESLRPDDSASVKAIEDEDPFSPSGNGLSTPGVDSDVSVSAFRDQLREISSIDPSRRDVRSPAFIVAQKGVLYVPPQGPGIGNVPDAARGVLAQSSAEITPDPKLLEALENPRDRVWVLKLEQDVIDFVKDAAETSLNLPQCNSFYRMLAHKMADYYMLGHIVDDSSAVRLFKTPNCRIPPGLTGIMTPSTATSTPPPSLTPQMKILRRGDPNGLGNGTLLSLHASENGESGNEDDKKPKPVTREEREARYEAARLRIMGSAKPSESPEASKEKQDSRSSSVTGRKAKKKQRPDSDDDFEARSAYSNYFAPTMTMRTDGIDLGVDCQQFSPVSYGQPGSAGGFQQMQGHGSSAQWPHQSHQQGDPSQTWVQGQPQGYDLISEFARNMSFQNQAAQHSSPQQQQTSGFGQIYGQQYFEQQTWLPQQYQGPAQTPPAQYGYHQNFPAPSAHAQEGMHGYAFGQLPSQAFPGRPANKLEHPLPGSYKSRHFNPQSQSFVPGFTNGNSSRPFTPQGPSGAANASFGCSPHVPPLQRQNSTQSQSSAFGASHPQSSPGGLPSSNGSRPQSRQLTHPLPQRVQPRQTSPSMPLPARPGPMPPRPSSELSQLSHSAGSPTQAQYQSKSQTQYHLPQNMPSASVVAMYGAPNSLPPKPPPATGPLDASRLPPPIKRPSFANNPAIAARQPSNGAGSAGSGYSGFQNMSTSTVHTAGNLPAQGVVFNGAATTPPIPAIIKRG